MSNTYTQKNYAKARIAWRKGEDPTGISKFWDHHRFRYTKTPRGSAVARYLIQTVGHKRRRREERMAARLALLTDGLYAYDECICYYDDNDRAYDFEYVYVAAHEDTDYEVGLPKNAKRHSDVWDHY